MKNPFLLITGLMIAVFICHTQVLAQEAEAPRKTANPNVDPVTLEILSYDLKDGTSGYPSFKLRMSNNTADTIWILKEYGGNYANVPNYFNLIRKPEYDFKMEYLSEAMPKSASYFEFIEPHAATEFTIKLEYKLYADESVKAKTVQLAFEYAYSKDKDFSDALSRYKSNRDRFYDGPLKAAIRPYFEKLSSLTVQSPYITVKIPRNK